MGSAEFSTIRNDYSPRKLDRIIVFLHFHSNIGISF